MKSYRLTIIISAITLLVFLGGYVVFYMRLVDANIEAATLRGKSSKNEAQGNETRSLEKLIKETEDARTRIGKSFIAHDDIAEFLSSIESIARISGITATVANVSEAPAPWDAGVTVLSVHLDVKGTFDQVYAFESVLQNLHLRVTLSGATLAFDGIPEKKTIPLWRGSFDLSIIERSYVPTP